MSFTALKMSLLPGVRTTKSFREQIMSACDQVGLAYATVVSRLLQDWVTGKVKLDFELDADFVRTAEEAFRSPETQKKLGQLALHLEKNVDYSSAIKSRK